MKRGSIIDHRVFTPYPKVRWHHEKPSRARIVDVPAPCLVWQLIDWLYDHILSRRGPSNRDAAGARVLDKSVQLRAFVGDRELYPWNHVTTGAFVTFKRLPFDDDLYQTPGWHATSLWDRTWLTDDRILQSFAAHQEYCMLLERDFRRSTFTNKARIVESLGRPVVRAPRRITGMPAGCMRPAQTPEEIEKAFRDNFGRLVVPTDDHAAFRRHVCPPRPAPRFPMLPAP